VRVPHCLAHAVNCILGDEALETGDFFTGLILTQAVMGESQGKDTVPFYEKFAIGPPGFREADSMVRGKGEKTGIREFPQRLGDGRRIDTEP
jgi:hypothetical protein